MPRVVILINKPRPGAAGDELDVLTQAKAVEAALEEMGYSYLRIPMGTDLDKTRKQIEKASPDLVFNLVESIGGKGSLIHFAPALLESMQIPFTGSGSFPMYQTTDKIRAKKLMRMNGIPTPDWYLLPCQQIPDRRKTYILKPVSEDGSVGIGDESVIRGVDLSPELLNRKKGGEFFLEEYLTGREFNLSVLGGKEGPEVLPPAEMIYQDYPAGKPRILGYAAKWKEDSFEYRHSVRRFDLEKEDLLLAGALSNISLQCWQVFETRGYVRVDFRLDELGRPQVIEINANPCISPDAGFPAACMQAGIGYTDMIRRILTDVS